MRFLPLDGMCVAPAAPAGQRPKRRDRRSIDEDTEEAGMPLVGIGHLTMLVGLTAAAVLQASNLMITRRRVVHRLAGTVIGVGLAFAVLGWYPPIWLVVIASRNMDTAWPVSAGIEELARLALSWPAYRPRPEPAQAAELRHHLDELASAITEARPPGTTVPALPGQPLTAAATAALTSAVLDAQRTWASS
jgi:hypothetical protein